MLDWSDRLARWLQGEGYAGLLGLDFVEYADPATGRSHAPSWPSCIRGMDGATYPLAHSTAAQRGPARLGASGERGVRLRHARSSGPRPSPGSGGPPSRFSTRPAPARGWFRYHVSRLGQGRCGVVLLGGSRDEVLKRLRRAPDLVPARRTRLRLTPGVARPVISGISTPRVDPDVVEARDRAHVSPRRPRRGAGVAVARSSGDFETDRPHSRTGARGRFSFLDATSHLVHALRRQ